MSTAGATHSDPELQFSHRLFTPEVFLNLREPLASEEASYNTEKASYNTESELPSPFRT